MAWLDDRITSTQSIIVAYEAAILAVGTNGVQSYTLDTGQNRQTVTHADLFELNKTLESLYNLYSTLIARRDGTGVQIGQPGW